MGWPQITMIVLLTLGVRLNLFKHGEARPPYGFGSSVFGCAITVWLLLAGGFFNPAAAQVPPAANAYRADLVRAAHAQWGLDAPVAALAAQVHQESGWNPQAISRVGAAGLAQFMPATARWWCATQGAPQGTPQADCQPHNPKWALRAMVGYDKYLLDRTPQRYAPFDRLWVALRGYNGGLGHWQAEATLAGRDGLPRYARNDGGGDRPDGPTRLAVDAACGRARRAPVHCAENLGYPERILHQLAPRYGAWGPLV